MSTHDDRTFKEFARSPASENSLRQKSVRGAFFMGTGGAMEFAVRLGSTLILARILAPEDFGLVAMVFAFTELADIVKDLGLGTATVQRKDITHREVSSLFWVNSICGGLVALSFCGVAPLITWFYEDDRLIPITLLLAITFLWGGMSVQHEALLSRQLRQGSLAAIRLSATFLSSCLGVAFALSGVGYWALVIREIARSLFYLLGVWWVCRWIPSLILSLKEVKSFLIFGRDLSFTDVLIKCIGKIDSVLIGKLFGPAELGFYRQAQNLILTPVDQFNRPIWSVAQPGLSSLQSDPNRYMQYYQRVVGFVALATIPLGIFVAIYAKEFTLVVLGEKWLAATPFLGILAIAAAIRPTVATTAIVLITMGRARVLLGLAIVHGLVLFILMIAGLPWGPLGIAAAHVLTSVLTIPIKLHYSFRGSPISIGSFCNAIGMPVLSSFFMASSMIAFRFLYPIAEPTLNICAGIGLGVITYFLPYLLLASGRKELWQIVIDIKNSFLSKNSMAKNGVVAKLKKSHMATS